MLALKRRLYQLILSLHPAAFRDRFAREMSLDFEDTLATYGFSRLLADATRSLARQWTTAPAFTRNSTAAPIPLHPLLAGHYLAIDDNNLKPFELLRGTLLFAVMLFVRNLAFSAGGNHALKGNLPGLPVNQARAFGRAQDGPFQPAPGARRHYAVLVPDQSVRPYSGSTHFFVRREDQTGGNLISSLPEGGFLLRCALVTLIVWLTSFLLRRSRTIGMRVALVIMGVIAIVAAVAFIPAHAPPAHAQVLHYPQVMRPEPGGAPSFQTATIRQSNPAPGGWPKPVSALAGAPHIESGDSIRTTLPIRSFIASVCGTPAESQCCILGGPAWLDSDTYDIQAKIDGKDLSAIREMSPEQQQYQIELMEQSLLVTRFHLKVHEEKRTWAAPRLASGQSPVEVLVIDSIERPSER